MTLYILIHKGVYEEDSVEGYFLDKEILNSYIEKCTRIWHRNDPNWYRIEEGEITEEVPNWRSK